MVGCDVEGFHGPMADPTVPHLPGPPLPIIEIVPGLPQVTVGQSTLLAVRLEGEGAATAVTTWESQDPGIATVVSPQPGCNDRCALLTGIAPGRTKIYAEAFFAGSRNGDLEIVTVLPQ